MVSQRNPSCANRNFNRLDHRQQSERPARVNGAEKLGHWDGGIDISVYPRRRAYQFMTSMSDRSTSSPSTTCSATNRIGIHLSMAVTAR